MGKKQLEDFINQKAEEKDDFNEEEVKNEWLQSIESLYRQVEGYLSGYGDKVKIKRSIKEMHEQHIGHYQAQVLDIDIAGEKVTMVPVGRFIIGAQGRIDMIGSNGSIKFLRVPLDSTGPKFIIRERVSADVIAQMEEPKELVWKVATDPPKIKFLDFNEESFADFLLEIIHD